MALSTLCFELEAGYYEPCTISTRSSSTCWNPNGSLCAASLEIAALFLELSEEPHDTKRVPPQTEANSTLISLSKDRLKLLK